MFIKLVYIEKNITLFKHDLQLPLPKNIKAWQKKDLSNAFDFLEISSIDHNGKNLTVPMLKDKLIRHLECRSDDIEKLKTYRSKGVKMSELAYSHVRNIIWLHKTPKFWVPSVYQMDNIFGRAVLTILLFSIPECFPPVADLPKFGYVLSEAGLKLNLASSDKKERNARLLLASACKASKKKGASAEKRKTSEEQVKLPKKKRTVTPLID